MKKRSADSRSVPTSLLEGGTASAVVHARASGYRDPHLFEVLGILAIAAVAIFALAGSWRRWVHPTIDTGRELHIPWRLAEGALLYRDVDNVYGPFSQYFNAGLFRLFGPGMMVLVWSNLVIFTATIASAYFAFRRAWGATGAVAAGFIFCSVFAFSQLIGLPVFSFALPYSHEATHGLLVSIALVFCLGRRLETEHFRWTIAAGVCTGLTLVIKPEFILAAGALTGSAALLHRKLKGAWPRRDAIPFTVCALAPLGIFTVYFGGHLGPQAGFLAANRAWSSLITYPEMLSSPHQVVFSGMDRPWDNLCSHGITTLIAGATLAGLWGLVSFALRVGNKTGRTAAIILAAAVAATVGANLNWSLTGRSLLVLTAGVLCLSWWHVVRGNTSPTRPWRILLATLGLVMMARMVLNGRIVQFGFYQAALAAMVMAAFIASEAAEAFKVKPDRRIAVFTVALAFLAPAGIWARRQSDFFQRLETHAVGNGRDRFLYFTPEIEPSGELLNLVVAELKKLPPETKVLALPEGSMVNYLARRQSPLPYFQYHSFTTEGGREAGIVSALAATPPEIVVILSRGLDDFGVRRYGERDGAGRRIIEWVEKNYEIAHHFGGDPLDLANQRGAYILRLRSGAGKPGGPAPQ